MILKPIKDQKIDNLVNESKDFQMKLTSDDVLKEFKARQAKKVEVESTPVQKKKKLFFPYITIPLTGLATAAIVIGVVVSNNQETIKIGNVSNNQTILTNEDVSKAIGKELLLFNFNYDDNNDVATKALKNAYKINYANSNFADSIDTIYSKIANGFEKISQIFLNGIFSFNDLEPEHKTLSKPKVIDGVEFDKSINYRYAFIINYHYYYSSDPNIDYGYTVIDTGIFSEVAFKTTIETVEKDGKKFIQLTLSKNNFYFTINNEGTTKALDNVYNYEAYCSKESYENKEASNSYYVNIDNEGNNSSFTLKEKDEYQIDYGNISNSIINLIMCSFDVNYKDYINNITKSFEDVVLKTVSGKNEYKFGDIVIKL